MLKLFNNIGEVSAQGGYSNPVSFDLDARFADEFVQQLTLSCVEGYTAHDVTLSDSGDTSDRYQFSINGASWADSVHFDCITANATCYAKARIVNDDFAQLDRTAKILLTYELKPATLPNFYYTNPGDAALLAVEGATTLNVNITKSITGKAFDNATVADLFHTPAALKEIWMRFDFWIREANSAGNDVHIGHRAATQESIIGAYYLSNYGPYFSACDGKTRYSTRYPIRGQLNTMLLHIKSDTTDGIVELFLNGARAYVTGNINGGGDLDCLCMYSDFNILFSNVVVSSGEINSACGWHRELFSLETVITAPVLNVRWQGDNHQFYLHTKKTTPALAVRVGDRNFYAPIVNGSDALASAVRLLLDDTNRALTT